MVLCHGVEFSLRRREAFRRLPVFSSAPQAPVSARVNLKHAVGRYLCTHSQDSRRFV